MTPRVLVTGGTGFLGRWVVPHLKETSDVTLLSRNPTDPSILKADLTAWDAGLTSDEIRKFKGRFSAIVHMAGLYDLRVPQVEALRHNLRAVDTALNLAEKLEVPHFVHISTVGVNVGDGRETVGPDFLDADKDFPDYYSFAKAQAEERVRDAQSAVIRSRTIVRPGILVGDSKSGRIGRIDGPYHAAEALRHILALIRKMPRILPVPGEPRRRLPVVPVDAAAKAISRITEKAITDHWEGVHSFFLTPKEGLSIQNLFESTLRELGISGVTVRLVNALPKGALKVFAEKIGQFPSEEVEYVLSLPRFDSTRTRDLLGENWCPEFGQYEDAFWKGYHEYVQNR